MTRPGDHGGRWRRLGRSARHSLTLRALVIACLLPVPVAFAAPPALVDSLQSASRAALSPDEQATGAPRESTAHVDVVRDVDLRGTSEATMAGVVTVPSSKARVRAVSLAGDYDIPAAALHAYRQAAATLQRTDPTCRVDWALLAGIGRVESDHGRYGGAVVHEDGTTSPHILGLPLDGSPGVAAIADSDGGRLDGDAVWDRAVGPMQFIPTTWSLMSADGDGDGRSDPHDIDDAALAAGAYLCAGAGDLSTRAGAEQAVYRYNHSEEYVALVLSLAKAYRNGAVEVPSTPVSGDGTATTLDQPPRGSVNGETDAEPAARQDSDRKARTGGDRVGGDRTPQGNPAPSPDTAPPAGGEQTSPPSDDATSRPESDGPGGGPTDGGGGGGGSGGGGGGDQPSEPPTTEEPQPEPKTVTLSGSVAPCENTAESLCVTDEEENTWTLVIDDAMAERDFDGDAEAESIADELTGVAEHESATVTLEVFQDKTKRTAEVETLVDAAWEITGSLDDPDGQWTITNGDAAWSMDLSQDALESDTDGDGTDLEGELTELAKQDATTLTVAAGEPESVTVTWIADIAMSDFEITATSDDSTSN